MPFQITLHPSILRFLAHWHHRQAVRVIARELRRLEDEYLELRAQWPAPTPKANLDLTVRLTQNDQAWLQAMTRWQHLRLPIT